MSTSRPRTACIERNYKVKLRITLNDKTFEVDVEVAEADTAALPPAYPICSAVLSGSVAGADPSARRWSRKTPPTGSMFTP